VRPGLAAIGVALALIAVHVQSGSAGPILAACRADAGGQPTSSKGHPPPTLLSQLAVLRHGRRQRTPLMKEYFTLHRIAVRYVRRLDTGPGRVRYYLIPATVRPSVVTTPVLCRHRPPRGVSRRQELKRERLALHSFGLYLVSIYPDGGYNSPSGLGGRRPRLLNNEITNLIADPRHTWLAGLVPDGVAAVRATFRQRSYRYQVTRNFWVVRLPGSIPPDRLDGITTEWLRADGTVRRSFRGF
jgi:hypothetical protein